MTGIASSRTGVPQNARLFLTATTPVYAMYLLVRCPLTF